VMERVQQAVFMGLLYSFHHLPFPTHGTTSRPLCRLNILRPLFCPAPSGQRRDYHRFSHFLADGDTVP
jgi:hypothetical protein